jgi:hypothetical protein
LSGFNSALQEVNGLYDHGYGGAGNSLISFGIALVMFPEPFMVSDVIGGGIVAAGLLYNHFSPAIFIDNVFDTILSRSSDHSTGEDVTELPPNVDFPVPLRALASLQFTIFQGTLRLLLSCLVGSLSLWSRGLFS